MSVVSLFPFPNIRDGQKEFLQDAKKAVEDGKHLIAYAPAGIGKTAAALTSCLECALQDSRTVFFLTSKRTQHRIAVETLRKISEKTELTAVDVIAKHAMCIRKEAMAIRAGFNEWCVTQQKKCKPFLNYSHKASHFVAENIMNVEELMDYCISEEMCPYRTAFEAAKSANVVVCDYNYIFSPMSASVLSKMEKTLSDTVLIVDEAHNLPDRIRENFSASLDAFMLRGTANEIKETDEVLRRHLLSLASVFDRFPRGGEAIVAEEEFVYTVEDVLKGSLEQMTYDDFLERLKMSAKAIIEGDTWVYPNILRVIEFLDGWRTQEKCVRILSNASLSYRLLDPSMVSAEIFEGVHASVLMSGTLYPTHIYADILGIPPARRITGEYRSPFAKKNRLVLLSKGITTRYVERGEMLYGRIASRISTLTSCIPRNAAAFFPSYEILERVASCVKSEKKILTEGREMSKREREGLFEKLMKAKSKGGALLLGVQGGSMSEGIDYYDNLLDAVFIVGLPLAPPSLEVKSIIYYYNQVFEDGEYYGYILPAMNKVLQAAGRLIRSESDRGVVILMDDRFIQPKYLRCFPKDFAFSVVRDEEKACKGFFGIETSIYTEGVSSHHADAKTRHQHDLT